MLFALMGTLFLAVILLTPDGQEGAGTGSVLRWVISGGLYLLAAGFLIAALLRRGAGRRRILATWERNPNSPFGVGIDSESMTRILRGGKANRPN